MCHLPRCLVIAVVGCGVPVAILHAATLPGASREVYKTVDGIELAVHIFRPDDHQNSDRRPAAVFFFGGGWSGGSVAQFAHHCRYLTSRGMIAMVADYRVSQRHGTTPFECVKDGKSVLRWVRGHASRLGIDPQRIAAGGGSAGGHVAAAAATLPECEEPGEDLRVSSRPNALLLFNPVYDNGPGAYGHKRFGDRYREISPRHNIRPGMPPTIVFLGSADGLVPVETARAFQREMQAVGSRSELFLYQGQPHGFFNHPEFRPQTSPVWYYQTVYEMDRFLQSLGYVSGEPTVAAPQFSFDEEAGERLDVSFGGKLVARYMFGHDPSTPESQHQTYKPYLHVFDAQGRQPITKGPGGQFTHHRGIFLGYSRLGYKERRYDFWHMKGVAQVHRRFLEREASAAGASFTSEIAWQDEEGQPLLVERRTHRLLPPFHQVYAVIEMQSELTAPVGDLVLEGDPEHAGAQFRPANEIVAEETEYHFHQKDIDPHKDVDLPWVGETFRVGKPRYSVVILNHDENPRQTRFSAYRDYGRFGAYPVLSIAEGKSAMLRYRWLVATGPMLPPDVIEKARQDFLQGRPD